MMQDVVAVVLAPCNMQINKPSSETQIIGLDAGIIPETDVVVEVDSILVIVTGENTVVFS
jgi:hypothetical protein